MAEAGLREDGRREERIEGVTMLSPAPSLNHNAVVGNLFNLIFNYLRGKRCRVFGDHVEVFLDENNVFQPEITVSLKLSLRE